MVVLGHGGRALLIVAVANRPDSVQHDIMVEINDSAVSMGAAMQSKETLAQPATIPSIPASLIQTLTNQSPNLVNYDLP